MANPRQKIAPASSPSGNARPRAGLSGFWSLFVTQFQGAFSDNVLKNLVIFLIIGLNVTRAEQHRIGESVGALFALPFILFSMAGGYLADRFSKRTVTIAIKIFEIFVMSVALAGLAWHPVQMPVLLVAVFLMGVHSAFFGPSKYGLLPELLPESRLSWGNGLLELGTFVAIILGIMAAGWMSQYFRGRSGWAGILLVTLAFAGLGAGLGITRVPAADPAKKFRVNFVGEVFDGLRGMRGDRPLIFAVIGNIYFNFIGALLLLNLFFYGSDVLRVNDTQIGFLSAALALGIGLGSVAAGYLSGGKIEYGLVPLGAFGLCAACASLAAPGLSLPGALVRLALLGFAGGFFIVPISALLQHRPDQRKKGEILALANLLSFVGVFLASGAHFLLTQVARFTPGRIFLFGAVATLAAAGGLLWLLPEALLRLGLWALTHTVYKIRIDGRDNIPEKSGALFVSNRLSFVDSLLLSASTDREIRFLMDRATCESRWIKPFARLLRAIPISAGLRPREMMASLRAAREALQNGEVVGIFAEGQITRAGHRLPFRRGFAKIMENVDAPIIPVALEGLTGSVFRAENGRFAWKLPRRILCPVTISFGRPLPSDATAAQVRQCVQELRDRTLKP